MWVANEVDLPDIALAGRCSEWEYYNSDHAFLAGRRAAELVRDGEARKVAQAARSTHTRPRDGCALRGGWWIFR